MLGSYKYVGLLAQRRALVAARAAQLETWDGQGLGSVLWAFATLGQREAAMSVLHTSGLAVDGGHGPQLDTFTVQGLLCDSLSEHMGK